MSRSTTSTPASARTERTPDRRRFDADLPIGVDGLPCLHPDGRLLGKIRVPQSAANLCFGGPKRNTLFITATTGLYGMPVLAQGTKTF